MAMNWAEADTGDVTVVGASFIGFKPMKGGWKAAVMSVEGYAILKDGALKDCGRIYDVPEIFPFGASIEPEEVAGAMETICNACPWDGCTNGPCMSCPAHKVLQDVLCTAREEE
jgi:hypothetical protein